jgi:hypothetical protein
MKHVFVAYAREDAEFARRLSKRLEVSYRLPWQDLRNLKGGKPWLPAIDDALRKAEALVVVMSPHATQSQYVTYEWAFAVGAGIPVIPVIAEKTDELHPKIESLQYIDFTTGRGSPWVNLLKSLPGPPTIIPIGSEIRAKFSVVGGKPEKEDGYYLLSVFLHKPPRGADQVTYEFHEETLEKTRYLTKAANFELSIQSNGDLLLTAVIRRPGKKTLRIDSSLYDALRRGHGSKVSPQVKRALGVIRKTRSLT